jgi:hypothetical protein
MSVFFGAFIHFAPAATRRTPENRALGRKENLDYFSLTFFHGSKRRECNALYHSEQSPYNDIGRGLLRGMFQEHRGRSKA